MPTSIPVTVVILATMLMMIVAAGVISLGLRTWVAPTGRHLAFLGVAGLCVAFGHFGLLLTYWLGRTSTVAPFFYSFALWGVVSGLIVWGELPNALALAGIALIAGSGIAIVVLDQRRGRKEIYRTRYDHTHNEPGECSSESVRCRHPREDRFPPLADLRAGYQVSDFDH